MNKLGVVLLMLMGNMLMAQDIFIARNAQVSFFSKTPLEDIAGVNKNVTALLNTKTNEVAVKMQIAQFGFPNKLMEEHFNENYMETEKYPTSTFTGKIQDKIDYTHEGTYDVTAKGILLIHGVQKERELKGKLTINKTGMSLTCDFNVPLADHKIDIPKIVFAKIAEVIAVKSVFNFVPYQK